MQPDMISTFQAERNKGLDERRAGQRERALAHFRLAATANPADRWNRNDIALELQALGRLDEAHAEAESLSAEAPDFAPAHRTLGLLARAAGDLAAAERHFRAAAERDPRDLWNRHDAATCLKALGRREEAAAGFAALAGGTPMAHALRALGEIARDEGRDEEALDYFRTAARLLPADPWFALDVATALQAQGRLVQAEETYEALHARHPRFVAAFLRRAQGAAASGDPEAARRHLEAAIQIAPGDAAILKTLAETLSKLGLPAEAETRFVQSLLARPGDAGCYLGLARIARLAGNADIAAAHLKAAEAATAHEPFARLTVAAEWLALGETGRARALYGELGERPETAAAAVVELAVLVRRSEGPKAARAVLERAAALHPGHPRALLLLADERRERGLLDEADAFYDRALAAKPDFYWALVGKAAVARGLGRPDEAGRHLLAAGAVDPLEGFAEIERAGDLRQAGRFEEAERLLSTIPASSPRAAQAALGRAHCARAAGNWAEASRRFEAVARQSPAQGPAQADALVEAAEDALRAGDDAAAERLLAEAEQVAPGLPALLEAEARRAMIQDEPERALRLYREAEARDPNRLSPALSAARIEMVLGRTEEGLAAFDRTLARFGERPEIALAHADMERQRGQTRAGEARLAEARRRFPHHFGLQLADIFAFVEAGRFAEAEAAIEEAPGGTVAEAGRLSFARSLLHAARFDFAEAVRHGEAAVAALPGDGWVANRLIHSALLALDLPRAGRHLAELARLEAGASRLRGKSANPSQSHYGQIFDEFRLDEEALAELAGLSRLPPGERAGRAAEIVADFPDSTAAAIRFFIEHRRAGGLTPEAAEDGAAIPPAIHQYWNDEEPPADLMPMIDSWRKAHPGFVHRLYDDTAARAILSGLADARILASYERAEEPAMKADLFRLALLEDRGGLYADADDLCLESLAPLLSGGHGLVCYQEDLGSLGNNLIAARAHHPVIARALSLAVEAVLRGDGDILWLATGPGLLTRAAAQILVELPEVMADIHVLARHDMLRHVSIHCLAAYKVTERHWSRTAFGPRRPLAKAS